MFQTKKSHHVNPLRHKVDFKMDDALHINVTTERLIISSMTSEDEKDCIKLLGDAEVMKKFNTGIPYDEAKTKERIATWSARWKRHDPFNFYTIRDKNSNEFMGMIGIGYSIPGESELSYAIHKEFWGQKFGTEAADAMVHTLIPRLMLRGYHLLHDPLKKLIATARVDNPASQKILHHVGFQMENEVYKYDALRFSFGLPAKQVRNEYHHFFMQRDKKLRRHEHDEIISTDVDVTDDAMADSSFGQQSYTAHSIISRLRK